MRNAIRGILILAAVVCSPRGTTAVVLIDALPAIEAAESVFAELAAGVAAPGRGQLALNVLEFLKATL